MISAVAGGNQYQQLLTGREHIYIYIYICIYL